MTNSRWSEELTCKFVQKYMEQNCLWDSNNKNYTSKVARNAALAEIVQHMDINGFGVEEARAKIRSLRSTYLSEKSKINKSLETATDNCNVYKSNLKWLHFFKPIMVRTNKRKSKDQENALSPGLETKVETLEASGIDTDIDYDDIDSPALTIDESVTPAGYPELNTPKLPTVSVDPLPKKALSEPKKAVLRKASLDLNIPKPRKLRERMEALERKMKEFKKNQHGKMEKNYGEEECDIFGVFISNQLKQLPLLDRISVQSELYKVVKAARVDALHSGINN